MVNWLRRSVLICIAIILGITSFPSFGYAALLNTESIALSNPGLSQSGVTYSMVVSNQSTAVIRCITLRFTGTLGSNSVPAGMDVSAVALDPTSSIVPTPGLWAPVGANGTGIVTITNAAGQSPVGGNNRTIILSNIKNGSAGNTTYYAELNTYSDVGCTASVDTEGVALFVFTSGVLITSTVLEAISFSITPSCSLGQLSVSQARTCTLDMNASTNYPNGYSISYSAPNTLHHVQNTDQVTAIGAVAGSSVPGTKQFGFNLVGNSLPFTGANPVGGTGVVSANYNTPNAFSFITSGATLASTSGLSANTHYTVSYIANIAPGMISGDYIEQQTYTIVVNP